MTKSRFRWGLLTLAIPVGVSLVLGFLLFAEQGTRRVTQAQGNLDQVARKFVARVMEVQDRWAMEMDAYANMVASNPEPTAIRLGLEAATLVRSVGIFDGRGRIIFPPTEATSQREAEFLVRIADLLQDPWVPIVPEAGPAPLNEHWKRFYWRDGVQLLYWQVLEGGGFLVLEPERSALLSELIWRLGSPLDGTIGSLDSDQHQVVLYDDQGQIFAQWGDLGDEPLLATVDTRVGLDGALQGWQIYWRGTLEALGPGVDTRLWLGLILGLGLAASLVLVLNFLQRIDREVREAGQRVSFVNQVSHELKTPLTNIRLYAELLQTRLQAHHADTSKEMHYSSIILRESARLGRLIHNVLTFAQKKPQGQDVQGHTQGLHPQLISPQEIITRTIEGFRVSFTEKNLVLDLSAVDRSLALEARSMDADVVEQILGNLLSNAEKYAREGGWVGISLGRQEDGALVFTVMDRGPGLPAGAAEQAFTPFTRFHQQHTDGVGGAGLGLAIVRDLAQRHGGDAGYRPHGGGGSEFWFSIRGMVQS